MQKHTRIYLKALRYNLGDPNQYIPSEISGNQAVDIHHIIGRGKKGEDRIENLMALTRQEHATMGDKKHWMVYLLEQHRQFLEFENVPHDPVWFEKMITRYED